ncbi:hypothetical protein DFH11DRAFT_1789515 [Phellopilus nigrolimitatus]|nr:hypothetical protein DFH11DRAFT_1789515 [Phellopilus nigrolimitatus]
MVSSSLLSTKPEEPPLPPTTRLPPIGRIGAQPLPALRAAVAYLRVLYNPEVRGTRRRRVYGGEGGAAASGNEPRRDGKGVKEEEEQLDALRADAFERAHAIRWLTALVSRAGDAAAGGEGEEPWDALVADAAALLAACAGAAASGRLARTFAFRAVAVRLADAPLENGDYASVGAQTWGGACVLADMLVGAPALFGIPEVPARAAEEEGEGRRFRVLELGAGTGLVGLAAARLLALRGMRAAVHLTDVHPSVLANLRANVAANFPPSAPPSTVEVSVGHLDWEVCAGAGAGSDSEAGGLGAFDLALGADIVYEAAHAAWLHASLVRLLAPHALFHLVVPLRRTHCAESGTVERVFGAGSGSEEAGRARRRRLGIVHQERFVCDADGRAGADEVEYAYFRIGWL